jgi:hypothetical protein
MSGRDKATVEAVCPKLIDCAIERVHLDTPGAVLVHLDDVARPDLEIRVLGAVRIPPSGRGTGCP